METFKNIAEEVWYRYDNWIEAQGGIDAIGEWVRTGPGHVRLKLSEFPVVSHTPKGVWLSWGFIDENGQYTKDRWVSNTSRKKFAYPTKEQALESFIARKRRQVLISKVRMIAAQDALYLAIEKLKNGNL